MPITIAGSGTITGISAGGLPDDSIIAADIAAGAVTPAKLSTGAPSWTSGGDLSFNSGYGSVATAYGCRAWVNCNGSGAAIRASGNVSSVTKNGTGDYTVNFTTAMPDSNYAVVAIGEWTSGTTAASLPTMSMTTTAPSASAARVRYINFANNNQDNTLVQIAIFR